MFVYAVTILLVLTGCALAFAILVQRGHGTGIMGLTGRMADRVVGVKSSAVFTRITVGLAIAWILLADSLAS